MTVRLVFRPYTDVRRAICTSAPWRTSTRVSPGFVLRRHRSPSFGYQQTGSSSVPLEWAGRRCTYPRLPWYKFASYQRTLPTGEGPRHLRWLRFHYDSGLFSDPLSLQVRWTPWTVFQDGGVTSAHEPRYGRSSTVDDAWAALEGPPPP